MSFQDLVQYFIEGFPVGCVYALVAVGIVLTYKTSGVFNLAFGAQAFLSAAVMYEMREGPEQGGLMSYGSNLADLFSRAASFVDRILKGAQPGDLPVEQPTRFELVLNRGTAKTLGIIIPPTLLQRTDAFVG